MNERPHSRLRLRTRVAVAVTLILALSGISACGFAEDSAETSSAEMAPLVDEGAAQFSEDAMVERDAIEPVSPGAAGDDASTVPPGDRLVIRTAGLRVDVEDVEESVKEIRAAADERGGMVTDVQLSTDEAVPIYRYEASGSLGDGAALSGYVTVRVPVESYDEFLDDIRALGEVIRQSESERDVTQESIDLNARLANLKAQEERLREFFDQATDVEDLLAIEQELTRIRSEIDALEGQIAYLDRQAAMSTVTIELLGPVPVVRPVEEDWGFVAAITDGVRGAAGVIRFAISFVIATSPLWVLAIVVALVIRVIIKRRRVTIDQQGDDV